MNRQKNRRRPSAATLATPFAITAIAVILSFIPTPSFEPARGDSIPATVPDPVPAMTPEECERYRPLLKSQGIGDDVPANGMGAFSNDGKAFRAGDVQRKTYVLKLNEAQDIPQECRKVLLSSKVTFHATSRLVIDGQPGQPFTPESQAAASLLANYEGMYYEGLPDTCMKIWISGPGKESPEFKNCVTSAAKATEKKIDKQIRSLDPNNLPTDVPSFISSTSLARVLQVYHGALWAKNKTDALNYLASVKNKLTPDEGLQVVQMFGSRFLRNYDNARAAALVSTDQERVVDFDKLLNAARGNTQLGLTGYWLGTDSVVAGVCRDIASAQGQMLEALGFRNTYVVSYGLASGSYHSTVITQDPFKDTRVYRLNYGERTDQLFGDNRALHQGPSDVTMNYRVFKPAGHMVGNVPSELGKFLSEAAGFDIRDLDPMARTRSSILGADMGIGPGSNPTQFRGGVGRDGNGSDYAFLGITQSWGQDGRFPGRAGIVIATSQRQAEYVDGMTGKPYNLDLIYLQIQQGFKTKSIVISDNLVGRIEGQATLLFMGGRAREDAAPDGFSVKEGDLSAQGDLRMSARARLDQKAWKDRFTATYLVGLQSSPGILDIRNNRIDQVPILALNHFLFSAEGRLRLTKTAEGRAFLVAATTVLINEMGARGRFEVGVATDKIAIMGAVEGRLSNNSAPYEDGTERRAYAQIVWRPARWIYMGVGGSLPLERREGVDNAILPIAPSATGTFGLKF